MKTTTKNANERKKEFPKYPEQEITFKEIMTKTDEEGNIFQVIFTTTDNERMTWKPEIVKEDKTGLIPNQKTIKSGIKEVDLPQKLLTLAEKIKKNGTAKVKTEYSEVITYDKKGEVVERRNAYFSQEDMLSMQLV